MLGLSGEERPIQPALCSVPAFSLHDLLLKFSPLRFVRLGRILPRLLSTPLPSPDPRFARSAPFLPRCMECRRGLAMRILSVRLSVTRVHCDETVERSVQIYIPYERTFILVF